jgi:AmpD protein
MEGIDAAGWLAEAVRYESPNCDARPPGEDVTLLVIHNASLPAGAFGSPHMPDLFTNRVDFAAHPSFDSLRGLEVSAHFMIRRTGRILQFVPTTLRAWHAGASHYQGRDNCNAFSVGIELEGSDHVAFEPVQYERLAALTRALLERHPIRDIAGHQHVAPGRKTDPGPFFDWKKYAGMLQKGDELVLAHREVRVVSDLVQVKVRT